MTLSLGRDGLAAESKPLVVHNTTEYYDCSKEMKGITEWAGILIQNNLILRCTHDSGSVSGQQAAGTLAAGEWECQSNPGGEGSRLVRRSRGAGH